MSTPDPEIQALREALDHSIDNVPLRRYLAELLYKKELYEDAEVEYRIALKKSPEDASLMLGLARAFTAQGKHALALVVFEEQLLKHSACPAEGWLAYADTLTKSGRPQEAVDACGKARQLDPSARDKALEERLGIGADPQMSEVVDGRLRMQHGDEDDEPDTEVERPKINFGDVGGMQTLKDQIHMKIIAPLSNKDLYKAYGKRIGGGILMYGPPGCGKTYLARATAGEIKSAFISVGLHDVLDMWIGQSEQKLHFFFQQARQNAPCVLFFDEVDALAANRSDMRKSAGRHLINQFLSELDGVEASNEGVLILAATNAPWHLDNAFRRPGRFDRILFVPPPDTQARMDILEIHLKDKPVEDIYLEKVAKATDKFSGADLESVVDVAVESALEQAMKQGKPLPLTTKMLVKSAKKMRASTQEWFSTARNHAVYANESGLYDEILAYLNIKK